MTGSLADFYASSDGESLTLDREAMNPSRGSLAPASGSDGGSPATTDTEGTLGSDGGSDGSFSPFEEPVESLGKEARPAEAIIGGGVGLSFLGSSVLAGATRSWEPIPAWRAW